MTENTYMLHLKQRLQGIDRNMTLARHKLEAGKLETKIAALAELSKLETQHAELQKRIGEAAIKHSEKWSEMHTGFQEDLDALGDTVERWILKIS